MYIVKKTMQHRDSETGEKVIIKASKKPQKIPKELVAEALKRGLAVKVQADSETDQLEVEKAEAEKAEAEKAEAEKAEVEKAEAEKADAEKGASKKSNTDAL